MKTAKDARASAVVIAAGGQRTPVEEAGVAYSETQNGVNAQCVRHGTVFALCLSLSDSGVSSNRFVS